MGLSLLSSLIGLGMLIISTVLLIIRKQRKIAIALLIAGISLIVVPYSVIYFFFN